DDSDGALHKVTAAFEFGDMALGDQEPGFVVTVSDLASYTTTGGAKKLARYRQTLPLRSAALARENDYSELFGLVDAANTSAPLGSDAYTTTLEQTVDVEEWFKIHVVQHASQNTDSFS